MKYESGVGMHIKIVLQDCINLSAKHGEQVEANFNGVEVRVQADSDIELLYRDWHRGLSGYISGPVGPYPSKYLTAEEIASDAAIAEKNRARWAAEEQKRLARIERQCAKVEREIAGIELDVDEAKWQVAVDANSDPYGAGCIKFAERFAKLLQARMKGDPSRLADVADEAWNDADCDEQMSGFSASMGRSLVEQTWRYGAELKALRT